MAQLTSSSPNGVYFTGPNRNDPQFHKNIGFFFFKLPFLSFVVQWAFVSLWSSWPSS